MPPHLEEFFGRYTGFEYNPAQPPTSEFRRLRKSYDWSASDPSVKHIPLFRAALVKEFNGMYGKEFRQWKQLCRVLDIELNSAEAFEAVRCSSHDFSPFVVAV